MAWGHGRLSEADKKHRFLIAECELPMVNMYKYLGVWIGCSGGWLHHFRFMAEKMMNKTREIHAWARLHLVPLTLTIRLWDLYVRWAVLYGANVCTPPPTATIQIDRALRCAGRVLLGFRRRAPGPAVLGELGWIPLSKELIGERAKGVSCIFLRNKNRCSNLFMATIVWPDLQRLYTCYSQSQSCWEDSLHMQFCVLRELPHSHVE